VPPLIELDLRKDRQFWRFDDAPGRRIL